MTAAEMMIISDLSRSLNEVLLQICNNLPPGSTYKTLRKKGNTILSRVCKGADIYSFDMNVNEIVCHSSFENQILGEGDLVTFDIVIQRDGLFADGAWSTVCGKADRIQSELLQKAWETARMAILSIIPGDSSFTMKKEIHRFLSGSRFSLMEEACGHGIGNEVHLPPDINFSLLNKDDVKWMPGMVFTIEPVLSQNSAKLLHRKEKGWISHNGAPSAYFEHMVAIEGENVKCLNLPEIFIQNSIDIF